jgi:hypothetical protein
MQMIFAIRKKQVMCVATVSFCKQVDLAAVDTCATMKGEVSSFSQTAEYGLLQRSAKPVFFSEVYT